MAYFNNDDENESTQGMNAQKPEDQVNGQAPQLSSGSGGASTAPIATGSQAAAPKATSSGMTGFQNYQKANAGTATTRLGDAANKNLGSQAQKAKSGINQATTSFGQKVDAGSLANRDTALTDVKNVVDAARNVSAPAAPAAPAPAPTTLPEGVESSTQAATAPVPAAPVAPVDPGKSTAALQGLAPNQTSRFQDVINAKYQGPESLRQSGDYQKAASTVGTAQTALDQSKTALGREALLKDMYSKAGNYTQGLNKLDAGILNASKTGVSQLADTAKAAGNLQGQLDQAQIGSTNLAQNRGQEISDIRNQSRDAFTTGKAAEEQATEDRLSSVIKDWDKLPEYFKNLVRNGGTSQLNSIEAATLGIGNNEGLYNLGADAIATGVADKNKLISKNEQARQAALAALGGLDQSQLLNTNLNYGDVAAAGTQTALDALDLNQTRANLNAAEQGFRDSAIANDITGYGSKKNKSSGKRYYAEESANLGNLLQNAGYDLNSELNSNVGTQDILKAIASSNNTSGDEDPNGLLTPYQNQSLGSQANSAMNDASTGGATAALRALGIDVPYLDQSNAAIDLGTGGATALLRNAGVNIPGITNIGSIFGSGSSSKESKNIASAGAREDLSRKINEAINASGYNNRAEVVDNDTTNARVATLQQLLANLDKTNV